MGNTPKPTGSESFHTGNERKIDALAAKTAAKLKELESTIDSGFSTEVKAWDNYKGLLSDMMRSARKEMDESEKMTIEAARRADEQLEEGVKIEWEFFEQRHAATLDGYIQRYQLYMLAAGENRTDSQSRSGDLSINRKISTETEFLEFKRMYDAFIKPINMQEIFAQAEEGAGEGWQQDWITKAMGLEGMEVPRETQQLFEKITTGEKLNERDYAMLRNEMLLCYESGKSLREKWEKGETTMRLKPGEGNRLSTARILITALGSQDRFQMLAGLTASPDFDGMMVSLVASNYVQASQAEALLDLAIQQNDGNLVAQGKLEEAKVKIYSKDVRRAQKENEVAIKEASKKVKAQFGHFNRAQRLLTVKNGFWALVAINFAATFAANSVMTLTSKRPWDIFTNPGVLGGAALAGAGLEFSDGLGGTLPPGTKPSEILGRLFKDMDEANDRERIDKRMGIIRGWGNDPHLTRLYYSRMQSIEGLHNAQTANAVPNPEITLEGLGMTMEDLPPQLQGRSEDQINEQLTQMNRTLRGEFKADTWQDQKACLVEAHENEHYGNYCLGRIDLDNIQ